MAVIDCKHVYIRYKTGDIKSIGLKEYFMQKIRGKYRINDFLADCDVTFSLEKGDMLGIIGTNGSGKSTLLKAITGIMVPTMGSVKTKGNIAALLELASGFDPDLTVRENTYLRGALLGYTREFINEKYDEIISFAELEKFQGHAFKQLSSGMKSRLAFSIACLVEPDILILDEVLSVGDAGFKEKSACRIKSILENGVTGILVSHSIQQVKELCNKVLWLDKGRQIAFGPTEDIIYAYSAYLFSDKNEKYLPKNEQELAEITRLYRIAYRLGVKERAAKINPPGESEVTRMKRLLGIVDTLTDTQKAVIMRERIIRKK